MARPPGTVVTTVTAPPPRGVPTDTGVLFCTGQAARGAVGSAIKLSSIGDFPGGRTAQSQPVYDALDVAFREGLTTAYFSRVVGPGAATATVQFSDRGGTPHPTVQANAASVGADGDNLTVAFANGTDPNTVIATVKYLGSVVDVSGELATVADIVAWQSDWVTFTDLASSNAAPSNLPAVIGDTALTGGNDDLADVTETQWTDALTVFGGTLGPGQVAAPGRTTTAAYEALIEHAAAFNRFALLDGADTPTVATLTSAVKTVQGAVDGSYGAYFAPWVQVPLPSGLVGTATTTTRTVPPSGLLAGLIARSDAINDADTAPMGPLNGASVYALDVSQTYTDDDRGTLNDASVDIIVNPFGTVMNYGLRSLDTSGDWTQFTNSRLRMQITALADAIGDNYVGQKIITSTIAAFQGDLTAMLTRLYNSGALYGDQASDSFAVNVGSSVNTPDSIAAGHLKAVLSVRMSESAEFVDIEIIKVPLTQSVAA